MALMIKILRDKKTLKALVLILELLAIGLVIYLIVLPIWPALKYKFFYKNNASMAAAQDIKNVTSQTELIINHLPKAPKNISANRLIITKIGVNAPIIEAKIPENGLSKGAWRIPESSTPDKGGNTVITGHRFKYLPPNNLTFFLFDKLAKDDVISVVWNKKNYFYKIKEIKIVEPTDLSILEPTVSSRLTLYTCDTTYSQKNRLVIIGEPVK